MIFDCLPTWTVKQQRLVCQPDGTRCYEDIAEIEIHIQPMDTKDQVSLGIEKNFTFYCGIVEGYYDIEDEDRLFSTQRGYEGIFTVHHMDELIYPFMGCHDGHYELTLARANDTCGNEENLVMPSPQSFI